MRRILSLLAILVLTSHVFAQRRGGPGTGNPDEHRVPWKFLEKDAIVDKMPITLYWFPASLDEANRSRLMTSRALLENSTRCIGLEIVLPENAAMIEKLGKGATAVVADAKGNVIQTTNAARPEAVEQMLSQVLAARDEAMYRQMTEANRAEKDVAIGLYKKIWDDRCMYPIAGNDARRALKRLGVTVQETAEPSAPDPYLKPKH